MLDTMDIEVANVAAWQWQPLGKTCKGEKNRVASIGTVTDGALTRREDRMRIRRSGGEHDKEGSAIKVAYLADHRV